MFESFLDELLMGLGALAMITITPFIIKLLNAAEKKALIASKSDYLDGWIVRLFNVAETVVGALDGTVVKGLKEKGLFTEEEKVAVFNQAKQAITDILAESFEEALNAGISDADKLIDAAIEDAVERLKKV